MLHAANLTKYNQNACVQYASIVSRCKFFGTYDIDAKQWLDSHIDNIRIPWIGNAPIKSISLSYPILVTVQESCGLVHCKFSNFMNEVVDKT